MVYLLYCLQEQDLLHLASLDLLLIVELPPWIWRRRREMRDQTGETGAEIETEVTETEMTGDPVAGGMMTETEIGEEE